jgi:membrane protein DedA with SNARE-associated domain
MAHAVTSFVDSYGVLAVLVLMTLESCGVPFPSEVVMPFGGALAASGHLSLAGVIVAGAVGNLVGSLVAYLLAARFGEAVVLGPGRWIGLSRRHLTLAGRWFDRYGLLAVFLGRLLPAVRTYISFPAGLARVDLARFSILTFVGALPWCAALAAAGYALGSSYDRISGPIDKVAIVLGVGLLGAVALWLYRGRTAAVEEGSAR